jgi:3-oxoacyl-(acyl-carrier-protein) synthase
VNTAAHKDAILIAGMGAVSAHGAGIDTLFEAALAGVDGLKPLSTIDSRLKTTPLCAEITFEHDYFDRYFRTLAMALIAVDEALSVIPERSGLRTGVVTATTVGGIPHTERVYEKIRQHNNELPTLVPQLAIHEPTVLSARICEHINGSGYHTISTACSSGLHALGAAKRCIEQGMYDVCLAVASDALSLLTIRGFASLTLLDTLGCRPFDRDRAGISLGEGAAAVVLIPERLKHLCMYTPNVAIQGWGASADCYHMTAPHPGGDGARQAVRSALSEAGMEPGEVNLISAHGTGTPDNDKAEIAAMQSLFDPLPPFFSIKRTIGHTLAASGILESVCAIKALQTQQIPITAGFKTTDEQIGAAPGGSVHSPIRTVLKNSFGFGGNNAAVLFSLWEDTTR